MKRVTDGVTDNELYFTFQICIFQLSGAIIHNSTEVNRMDFLTIVTQVKQRTKTKISYYFDVNVGYIEEEVAGILIVDLDYFDGLPDHIDDYSMHVIKNMISKKIIVEKSCSIPKFSEDADDYMGLYAMVFITKQYMREKKIPTETFDIDRNSFKKVFEDKELIDDMIERNVITLEILEKLKSIINL